VDDLSIHQPEARLVPRTLDTVVDDRAPVERAAGVGARRVERPDLVSHSKRHECLGTKASLDKLPFGHLGDIERALAIELLSEAVAKARRAQVMLEEQLERT
jgi:hypothetical protein